MTYGVMARLQLVFEFGMDVTLPLELDGLAFVQYQEIEAGEQTLLPRRQILEQLRPRQGPSAVEPNVAAQIGIPMA